MHHNNVNRNGRTSSMTLSHNNNTAQNYLLLCYFTNTIHTGRNGARNDMRRRFAIVVNWVALGTRFSALRARAPHAATSQLTSLAWASSFGRRPMVDGAIFRVTHSYLLRRRIMAQSSCSQKQAPNSPSVRSTQRPTAPLSLSWRIPTMNLVLILVMDKTEILFARATTVCITLKIRQNKQVVR